MFDGGIEEGYDSESDEEREERLKEREQENKHSWDIFVYTLIQGDFLKLEDLMGKNYRMALWFKSVEKRNKKLKEYYDYGRYNIEIFSKQR